MTTIEATIATTFKQAREAVALWQDKVKESCRLVAFPHQAEAERVVADCGVIMTPLVYARLVVSVTLTLGVVEVRFAFRPGVSPETEDKLDVSALGLVREPPGTCLLTFHVTGGDRAAYFGAGDLERCGSCHVKVTVAGLPGEAESSNTGSAEPEGAQETNKEDADGSAG